MFGNLLVIGGIGIIILILIMVIVLIVYMIRGKQKSSPEKPIVDYPKLVRNDVFTAFIDYTKKDRLMNKKNPLTEIEKYHIHVSMGIANSVYSKYADNLKQIRTKYAHDPKNLNDNVMSISQKMDNAGFLIAQQLNIPKNIILYVLQNYLSELSNNLTSAELIKKFEKLN